MSVVPFQDFATADQDRAWDGAAAHKRALAWVGGESGEWPEAKWRKFRSVHLWYDGEAAETVGAYKFQIADIIDGAPKYVFRAASAALAILRGGRGAGPGADWWGDRAAMEGHVRKIYKKFGADFPASKSITGLEYKTFQLEIKAADEQGIFTGCAATYAQEPDLVGDVVKPGCFTKSLQEQGAVFPLLWSHHLDEPVGLVTLADSAEGLLVERGELELDLPEGQRAYTRVRKKLARGLSIGFDRLRTKSFVKSGVRYLTEIPLLEVSLCTIPVDQGAWVTSVKALLAEKASFAEVLERIELMGGSYQMFDAIRQALWSIVDDRELSDEEKIAQADESLDQFHQQYMEYLPRYLAAMAMMMQEMRSADGVIEGKAGRRISTDTAKRIQEAMRLHEGGIREHQRGLKVMKALLETEAARAGTSAKGAAADPEPDDVHSLDLSRLFQTWGSYLPTAKTRN